MAEKSEKATPKKLRDARKKGQVAKSQDLPAAFTFIVAISVTLSMAKNIAQDLGAYIINSFQAFRTSADLPTTLVNYAGAGLRIILKISLPILLITVITGVIANVIVVGPLFSFEAMKPDLKRLNPIDNLKAKFKLKTLVELIKQILKISGVVVIIYFTIKGDIREIIFAAGLPVLGSAVIFNYFLVKVIIRVGLFFIAIAIFDIIYQKMNFAKEMKMEKFEVKQEYKDTEGDPHIKGRRRQIGQEIAYEEGSVNNVKKSKAVITNPTHFAVAFEYDAEIQPAPKILVKGSGKIAEIIIREAEAHHIPIVRNVPLARQLIKEGKVGRYIPRDTYEAVAEILKWLASLETE
ncbi:MAG: Yop proteins translocation protein U [Chlamydiae bacterium]|nr:Yop proteins translocation protein U [Chlamydiota bacterium]